MGQTGRVSVPESLQVGCARVDLTPPLGVYLAGHFNARQANGLP